MKEIHKTPKDVWDRLKLMFAKRQLNFHLLSGSFFYKDGIEENGKSYTTYSLSPTDVPFLTIKNVKQALTKEQLKKSSGNPIDFTGMISMEAYKLGTWPAEEMLAFYCYKNINLFEYLYLNKVEERLFANLVEVIRV